jgi:hypothetical protein
LTRQGLAHHRCVAGHINLGSIDRERRSMVIICWNSSYPSHFMQRHLANTCGRAWAVKGLPWAR